MSQQSMVSKMFASPIVLREMRVAGRSMRFFAALMLSLIVQAVVVTAVVLVHAEDGSYPNTAALGRDAFVAETIAMLVTIVVVFPAFSCMSIVSERESRSLDMLKLSHLAIWEIVFGKLVAALAQASLIVTSAVPIYILTITFGGVPLYVFALALGGFFLISVLISMVGIYSSVVFKRPIAALIVSYIGAQVFGFTGFMLVSGIYVDLRMNQFGFVATLWQLEPIERFFIISCVVVGIALYFAFFFLVSVSRLKTASQNRSGAIRIFSLVAVGIAVLAFVGMYFASERIEPTYLPIVALVLVSLIAISALFPAIKATSETAFASRVVRRDFEQVKGRSLRKLLRWFVVPGSTSAFVLSVVLSAVALSSFSFSAGAALSRSAEHAPVAELSRGLERFQNWGSRDVMRRVDADRRVRALSHASQQHATKAYESTVRNAYATLGGGVWRLAGLALFCVAAFSLLGWALSFSSMQARTVAACAIGVAIVSMVLPELIASVEELSLERLRYLSPVQAWREATNLMVLDGQQALALDHGSHAFLEAERASAYQRMIPALTLVGLIGVASLVFGLRMRQASIQRMKAAGGRWPIPKVPQHLAATVQTEPADPISENL